MFVVYINLLYFNIQNSFVYRNMFLISYSENIVESMQRNMVILSRGKE